MPTMKRGIIILALLVAGAMSCSPEPTTSPTSLPTSAPPSISPSIPTPESNSVFESERVQALVDAHLNNSGDDSHTGMREYSTCKLTDDLTLVAVWGASRTTILTYAVSRQENAVVFSGRYGGEGPITIVRLHSISGNRSVVAWLCTRPRTMYIAVVGADGNTLARGTIPNLTDVGSCDIALAEAEGNRLWIATGEVPNRIYLRMLQVDETGGIVEASDATPLLLSQNARVPKLLCSEPIRDAVLCSWCEDYIGEDNRVDYSKGIIRLAVIGERDGHILQLSVADLGVIRLGPLSGPNGRCVVQVGDRPGQGVAIMEWWEQGIIQDNTVLFLNADSSAGNETVNLQDAPGGRRRLLRRVFSFAELGLGATD